MLQRDAGLLQAWRSAARRPGGGGGVSDGAVVGLPQGVSDDQRWVVNHGGN